MENLPALNLKNLDKSQWKTYRFDEIAKNISERVDPNKTDLEVYVGLEHIDSESIHLTRSGTPDDVDGQKLRFYPGDLIFGRRRAYQRKAAVATTDGFCSAHALVLRAKPEVIDPQLFPFFMHSDAFMHRAVDISVGSLSPTINWGTLKHQTFLLPPKDIQLLMMELLSKIDAQINSQNEVLMKTETLKLSILKRYFESASTHKKIKELGEVVTGGTPSVSVSDYWDGDTPFITPAEITDNPTTLMPKRFLTKAGVEKSRSIPKNSILTVCIGTIGKVAINEIDCCTNQQINALIPFEQYHSLYLLNLLKYYKNKIVSMSGATTIQIINKSSFESISLPINKEAEIDSFVSEIGILEELYQRLNKQIRLSQILQKNLINQIF